MTSPQEYVRRPERVQAMRYTAETCRALHEWLGIEHHGDDDDDCGTWITVPGEWGRLDELHPGMWAVRKGDMYEYLHDAEFRAWYMPAGEAGVRLTDSLTERAERWKDASRRHNANVEAGAGDSARQSGIADTLWSCACEITSALRAYLAGQEG